MSKTISVIGGGTGGHFFTATSIAFELMERGHNVHIMTDPRCKRYIQEDSKIPYYILSLNKPQKGLRHFIISAIKMFVVSITLIKLYKKNNVQLVVATGGYPTFPALLAARVLRIPIVLHEQNYFLGKVNKMFANYASVLALPDYTVQNLPRDINKDKIIIAGIPIRHEFKENNYGERDYHSTRLNIMVIGGSQGAHIFSQIIPTALELVMQKLPKAKFKIYQQVAPSEKNNLEDRYHRLGISYELQEFFVDIPRLYAICHFAISRSGASSVSEMIYTGTPPIFIPYPYATNNHQYWNAQMLINKNAGWCITQDASTTETLAELIIQIVQDRSLLETASKNLMAMHVHSEKLFLDKIEKVITCS